MLHYGVEMQLPDGKGTDNYAQLIKALAAEVRITDRDKELLIVESEEERDSIISLLNDYKLVYEEFELLRLPDGAEVTLLFDDYGFVSASNMIYLYAPMCALFKFVQAGKNAEPKQAAEQMEEHLLARFSVGDEICYAVDRGLSDLIRGIAKAYRCQVQFIYEQD